MDKPAPPIAPLNSSLRIYVAGHRGMVGSAILRALEEHHFDELITASRDELDLCNQAEAERFFARRRPDLVVFAAAKVGGIQANHAYPAEFLYQNLMMAANSIHAAYQNGVRRFLFLGSTCIYPKLAPQPMSEDCLLSGPLEPTNQAYALAKIAGLKMCEHYRQQYGVTYHSAMPTNLYGPGDNYHPENSHVMPALIRRFHEAKQARSDSVTIWGTGEPRREFLHVDDLAAGVLHLLALEAPPNLVNIGTGTDITILELARKIAKTVGFEGEIVLDKSKPDGTPVKRTDISLIRSTGWEPRIDLESGLARTYQDFLCEIERGCLREV